MYGNKIPVLIIFTVIYIDYLRENLKCHNRQVRYKRVVKYKHHNILPKDHHHLKERTVISIYI